MEIDRIDLRLIRALEQGGRHNLRAFLAPDELSEEETAFRMRRLEAEGVIKGYRLSLFLPAVLGGSWDWAVALTVTREPDLVESQVLGRLQYPIEFIHNQGLPPGLAPNLVVLFYTQDLMESVLRLKGIPEVQYLEVYRISSYSFSLSQGLSRDEWRLVEVWAQLRGAEAELAQRCEKDPQWVSAKLEKLTRRPENPRGVVLVRPEFDFSRVDNFLHAHFLLKGEAELEELEASLKRHGMRFVPYHRRFRESYYQVEADLWGLKDLTSCHRFLSRLPGLEVHAILYWESSKIESDWILTLPRGLG